jgi:hypothetical protein
MGHCVRNVNDLANSKLPYSAVAFLGSVMLSLAISPGTATSQAEFRYSSVEEMREAFDACMAEPSAEPGACTKEVMFSSGAELEEAVRNAGPTDIFAVDMEFDEPARLGRVRDVAVQLAIPRVLARPELPTVDGGVLEIPPLTLGTLSEELDAWPAEVCKATVTAALLRVGNPTGAVPEDWPVRSINVYGPAFAVQQLLTGSLLPRARLISGLQIDPRVSGSMRGTVARDVAQPVTSLAGVPTPPECQSFAYQQDGEVLYGRSNQSERLIHNRGDSDSPLIQELAKLPPDKGIQLGVEFEDVVTLEILGTLVERYSIDGLVMSFRADVDSTQVSMFIELGVDGDPIVAQLRYYRCAMQSQEQTAASSFASRLSIATVFIDVASTWSLLADRNVRAVELQSQVSADNWNHMKAYFGQPLTERERVISLADNCMN